MKRKVPRACPRTLPSMPIPDQVLEEIQNKVDIVEVISAYVALKKTGRNYKGLCPFHGEKTPSFIVSQEKQIYHCFGCNAGGNVFGFLMRYERMEFPEAVEFLAHKAGVKLPSLSGRDKASESLAAQLYEIHELACTFYQDNLTRHNEAMDYLRARGIQGETIKAFRLGFALGAWDGLTTFLKNKNVSPALIEKAGLAIPSDRGGFYDRFRERIIFPICDQRNRVAGFGGRVLDSSVPKYVNSPETYIYSKGKNLYGLNVSKEYIRRKNYAILVEGYIDLLVPFQAGVRNIVATQGTALTQDQARLLKRSAKTCVVVYDPDEAGEAASLRNLELFIHEGISVYIATLTQGYDPDSYIRAFGVEDFNKVIKGARNLFDYKLDVLKSRFNPAEVQGKVEIASEMLPTIAKIDNAILQSSLVKRLAEALSVDEESLRVELKKVKPEYRAHLPAAKGASTDAGEKALRDAEKMLLALMLEERDFVNRAKDIVKPEDFSGHTMREIVRALFDSSPQGKGITPGKLLSHFTDNEEAGVIVSEAVAMNEVIVEKDRVFVDCIEAMQREHLKRELEKLQEEIKVAQASKDEGRLKMLVERYNGLVRVKKT